jgi:YjbE family integral membrane protein
MSELLQSLLTGDALWALGQVIMIDLVLAGDNAVVIGLAAAGLPKEQRNKAILVGIVAATVLRIVFALTTTQLLAFGPGLLVAGGLLLLWVCWKMWRELRDGQHEAEAVETVTGEDINADGTVGSKGPRKTFSQAAWQIVIADVSMSLDNVLAVAAVSRHNEVIMWFGLILSVVLMGVAASIIARVIERYRWIAVVGIIIIIFAGVRMVWEDGHNFLPAYIPAIPSFLGGH